MQSPGLNSDLNIGLNIDLYADSCDLATIAQLAGRSAVRGFTTNPTLARRAGVGDYLAFVAGVLDAAQGLPVSVEVLADEFPEMRRQAIRLAQMAPQLYVKVPITNTRRESAGALIAELAAEGVNLNVTAVFTLGQVRVAAAALAKAKRAILSVFAGRIADTGRDPVPIMAAAANVVNETPVQLLWASPRELLNIVQAAHSGCDIITMPSELLNKLALFGRDLEGFSLETVKMFHDDARAAGYEL